MSAVVPVGGAAASAMVCRRLPSTWLAALATVGFGFIQPSDGGKDVFVHISAVERSGLNGLNEGQKISYEIATERGRSAAVNLKASD